MTGFFEAPAFRLNAVPWREAPAITILPRAFLSLSGGEPKFGGQKPQRPLLTAES